MVLHTEEAVKNNDLILLSLFALLIRTASCMLNTGQKTFLVAGTAQIPEVAVGMSNGDFGFQVH